MGDFFTKSKNQRRLEKQVASLKIVNEKLTAEIRDQKINLSKVSKECESLKEYKIHTKGFISSLNKETEDYLRGSE